MFIKGDNYIVNMKDIYMVHITSNNEIEIVLKEGNKVVEHWPSIQACSDRLNHIYNLLLSKDIDTPDSVKSNIPETYYNRFTI